MTSKQSARLDMYNAIINYSDDNTVITATVAAYAPTLTTFKEQVDAIVDMAQLEADIITGIAINKAALKKELCVSATVLAAAIYAYATAEDDLILQQKAKYVESDFVKLRDDEITIFVQNLHDLAVPIVVSLGPFNVTVATLADLQTLINDYQETVTAPRNAKALRKTYNVQLALMFKEADTFLRTQLDKLALQFILTDPMFYDTYKNNRRIINVPTSSTQVKGIITDSLTGLPIYLIMVTAQNTEYSTTSELDGSYSLKIPVPGVYTLLFTSEGYLTHTVDNIELMLGQAITIDAQLLPTP